MTPAQETLLLSRPVLPDEALPYWEAFQYLNRDRDFDYVAMGPRLPRIIKRGAIRADGKRRGYTLDALDDFVEIVAGIDDAFVAEGVKTASKQAKLDRDKADKNRGATSAGGQGHRRGSDQRPER